MYVQIQENVKCSKCGTLNNYEDVNRKTFKGIENFRRCLNCKHERVTSVMTTSGDSHISIINQANSSLKVITF